MITDSVRKCYWNDTTIAFQNGGGIRSNIPKGELTYEDVFSILPFNNTIDRVTMTGEEIRIMLEEGVSDLCPNQTCYAEGFLHLSGIKMTVLVTDDNDENYCNLEPNKVYNVSLCSFLAGNVHRRKTN